MNKQFSYVAIAAVGLAAMATWSLAQAPKLAPATKSSAHSTTGDGAAAEVLPKTGSSAGTAKSGSSLPGGRGSVGGKTTISGTSAAAEGTTISGGAGSLDPSLAPFRGTSGARSESIPGSSAPSGTSIRIDHALVTSLDPIKLPARDAGAIREMTAKKGVEVKAGEILGQLDDQESLAKLKIAEKDRDAAQIQAENNAQIDAAEKGEKVTMENLKANEEIRRKSPGALSDFDWRRSQFEWERSVAQILVAKMEKAVAEATRLAKEAQIDAAEIEIERRKIVAPIDGFVNEVYKHKGEWCQPGDPVLELVRLDRLEIEGFVFAADASPSQVLGKPVDVVVQIAGGNTYKASGKVSFASPVLEGSGRIRQFRVSTEIENKKVPGEDGDLHWLIQSGTEAEMTIQLTPPKPAIAPKSATPTGAKSGLPGTKVEAFKPATPELGSKSGFKTDAKEEPKVNAKNTTPSATKNEPQPETKSHATTGAKSSSAESKTDATAKESQPGEPAKDSKKSGDSPAGQDSKEPTKSSKRKL